MAKYAFDYETGEYECIECNGFSIDRGEYTYNWDDRPMLLPAKRIVGFF